jgi:Zn-dependent peptidase ImmA (M78 family)/DNA-binding XRE family transcriptional regulator
MARREVPITGSVLAWAREEAGLSPADVAEVLHVDVRTIESWESGATLPGRGQFTKLAELLRRPTALFFLPEPPSRAGLPTSLRSAPGLMGHRLSKEEVRQIRWARRLQEIVGWVLRDEDSAPVTLPQFSPNGSSLDAAATVRQLLGVTPAEQLAWESPSEALRSWREVLEGRGILVVQLQLGRESLRGFSAWDDRAPIVGVNTAYHPTARIFTLFHEIGHLVTRTDAACLRFIVPGDPEVGTERWCERFAAEVLIPADVLRSVASRLGVREGVQVDDVETARRIAGRFKVSTRAASLRLQELQLAAPSLYGMVVRELADRDWNAQGGGSGSGQPAPEKRLRELGTRVPEILINAAEDGRITRSDLSDYLNLTTGQVDDLRSLVVTRA